MTVDHARNAQRHILGPVDDEVGMHDPDTESMVGQMRVPMANAGVLGESLERRLDLVEEPVRWIRAGFASDVLDDVIKIVAAGWRELERVHGWSIR